jgi:hypothetical protein
LWDIARIDRISGEIQLEDVVGGDKRRRERPRHQEALRVLGVPYRHVPERVEYAQIGENSTRCRDVFEQSAISRTATRRRSAGRLRERFVR